MRQREEDIVCYLVVEHSGIVLDLVLQNAVELVEQLLQPLGSDCPVLALVALKGKPADVHTDRFELKAS